MTTLTTMKARLANELARADLTDEISDAITTAIRHYQWKRFWFNEDEVATSVTVDGTEYYDAPTTFLSVDAIKGATVGGSKFDIDPTTNDDIRARQVVTTTESQPYLWAESQGQYRFYPIPDAVYTLTWSGVIDRLPASGSEADNPWMTYGESLIRQRAKAIVRIDVLRAPAAIQEAAQMAMMNEDYLSIAEKSAYRSLSQQTRKRTNTGRFKLANY